MRPADTGKPTLSGNGSSPFTGPPRWREAVEDHRRMIEALEDRDAAAFARLAREHTRHQAEVVHQALQAWERKLGAGPRPVNAPAAAAD